MLDRTELIKKLYDWQNAMYRASGQSIHTYPFICFDHCSNQELLGYAHHVEGDY